MQPLRFTVNIQGDNSKKLVGALPHIMGQPFFPVERNSILWFGQMDVENQIVQDATNTEDFHGPITLATNNQDQSLTFTCNVAGITEQNGHAIFNVVLRQGGAFHYPHVGGANSSSLKISVVNLGSNSEVQGCYCQVQLRLLAAHKSDLINGNILLLQRFFDNDPTNPWLTQLQQWLGSNDIITVVRRLQSWTALCFDIGTSSMTVKILRQSAPDHELETLVDVGEQSPIEPDTSQCPVCLLPLTNAALGDVFFPMVDKGAYNTWNEYSAHFVTNVKSYLRSGFGRYLKKYFLDPEAKVDPEKKDYNVADFTALAYRAILHTPYNDKHERILPNNRHNLSAIAEAKEEISLINFAIPNVHLTKELDDFFRTIVKDLIAHYDLQCVDSRSDDSFNLVSESKAALLYEINMQRSALIARLSTDTINNKIDTVIFDVGAGTADISLARITLDERKHFKVELLANASSDLAGNFFDLLIAEAFVQYNSRQPMVNAYGIVNEFFRSSFYHADNLNLTRQQLIYAYDYTLLAVLKGLADAFSAKKHPVQWQVLPSAEKIEADGPMVFYNSDVDFRFYGIEVKDEYLTFLPGPADDAASEDKNQSLAAFKQKVDLQRGLQRDCLQQIVELGTKEGAVVVIAYGFAFKVQSSGKKLIVQLANVARDLACEYFEKQDAVDQTWLDEVLAGIATKAKNELTDTPLLYTENLLKTIAQYAERFYKPVVKEASNDQTQLQPVQYVLDNANARKDLNGTDRDFFKDLKVVAKLLKHNDKIDEDDPILNELGSLWQRYSKQSYLTSELLEEHIAVPVGATEATHAKEKSLSRWIEEFSATQVDNLVKAVQTFCDFDIDWLILTGRGGNWVPFKAALLDKYDPKGKHKTQFGEIEEGEEKAVVLGGLFKEDYTVEQAKKAVVAGVAHSQHWGKRKEDNRNSMFDAKGIIGPSYYMAIFESTVFAKLHKLDKTSTYNIPEDDNLEIFTTTYIQHKYEGSENFYYRCVKNQVLKKVSNDVRRISVSVVGEQIEIASDIGGDVFSDHIYFAVEPTPTLRLSLWPDCLEG